MAGKTCLSCNHGCKTRKIIVMSPCGKGYTKVYCKPKGRHIVNRSYPCHNASIEYIETMRKPGNKPHAAFQLYTVAEWLEFQDKYAIDSGAL